MKLIDLNDTKQICFAKMKVRNVFFLTKVVSRWSILVIDLVLCFVSIVIAYNLRFNFSIPSEYNSSINKVLALILIIKLGAFILSGTYAIIIRYTSTKDVLKLLKVLIFASAFIFVLNSVRFFAFDGKFMVPVSVLLIDLLCSIFLMTLFRLVRKAMFFSLQYSDVKIINVAIIGADDFSLSIKRLLERDTKTNYHVVAFFDDNKDTLGGYLDGITVFKIGELKKVCRKEGISTVIFAKKNLSARKKKQVIDLCLNYNLKVLTVPAIDTWSDGQLKVNQLKRINIEDLLERDPICLDEIEIAKNNGSKVIMVSGAAGSIGSEIVRQLIKYGPQSLILLDQAESPLYDLELELKEKFAFNKFQIVIGSITDTSKMNRLFEEFRPQVIYHAAAYKHVPMMEDHPEEAVKTNVYGTKLLADLSVKYGVEKFVMISSDKAVNPTNVMGASKRIAEMYIQSLNKGSKTKFITTRFGNVLGSNGSVVPRFKEQIENGGPLTITHPEITRFFMTIHEASQLVLEAGTMGKGGEIYLFDMGEPVKILDLAQRMIKLAGLEPYKDIEFRFTGLRPGEKLYEELLAKQENTLPTHHSKILIAKVREGNYYEINSYINDLLLLVKQHNNNEIVKMMKFIVPEYQSKNSKYEILDIHKN